MPPPVSLANKPCIKTPHSYFETQRFLYCSQREQQVRYFWLIMLVWCAFVILMSVRSVGWLFVVKAKHIFYLFCVPARKITRVVSLRYWSLSVNNFTLFLVMAQKY
jgi:hypothetical protein